MACVTLDMTDATTTTAGVMSILLGQRNTSDRPGPGVKRVAPTAVQYWARDLASDYRYHGRQQEVPRIARTRLLYSAKASQRRDKRPQDACSHDRCCGRSGIRHVKRHTHHACFQHQEEHQREESSARLGGSLRRARRARPRLF